MANSRNTEVEQLRAGLLAIEPELRTLEGMIAILRLLGEADDAVDPACLSFLANCGTDAVSVLSDSWRHGMEMIGRM